MLVKEMPKFVEGLDSELNKDSCRNEEGREKFERDCKERIPTDS